MTKPIHGKCLCGEVKFEVIPPFCQSAHCHCSYCRRAHGAAFVTWVLSPTEKFSLLSGENVLRWYTSSPQSRRAFCSICGTPMFFESTLSPGQIDIARATLGDDSEPPPRYHCFVDQKVPWIVLNDDLVQLTTQSPELAKYRVIPPKS